MSDKNLTTPDYRAFSDLLAKGAIAASGSEIQGIVVGVQCLPNGDQVDWLELMLSMEAEAAEELSPDLSRALLDLSRLSRKQLESKEFSFVLFLPDSDAGLGNRTEAIAAWCRGFLLGISATGLSAANSSDVVKEILADLVELSSVKADHVDKQAEERALLEIEEYLRVAARLLKEELAA